MQNDTVIAVNRFGLGARPGELGSADPDPRGWLLAQLQGPARLPAELRALPDSASVLVEVQQVLQQQRGAAQRDVDEPAPDIVQKFGAVARRHYLQQTEARFQLAAATGLPFHERLVGFWANHFAVSADKPPIVALAGLFANEAIRPHLSGRFADLLLAVEKHPAMIIYLDNQRSVGPNSAAARQLARRRGERQVGLNENLAREILELHTLGVDGGYTQADVTSFARVITGWSIGGGDNRRFAEGTPGSFHFRENIHEPGSQTVLGKRYAEAGIAQGEAVLADLARHPATARFIATKLARHFAADEPPPGMVERLERVFLDTDGHLPSVHAALVADSAPWTTTQAKYKTPQEFVVSTFRAFDRPPEDGRFVVAALDMMGQAPFRPGSPAGWPDDAGHWGGADSLYKRIEWSNAVARYAGPRARPMELAESALGPALGDHTRTAISRAASVSQGVALLLASPEFQRR